MQEESSALARDAHRGECLVVAGAHLPPQVHAVVYGINEFLGNLGRTVDLVTALLLFGLLGWRWAILPGLVAEAIPGVAVLPMWLLVVASVALWGERKRPAP